MPTCGSGCELSLLLSPNAAVFGTVHEKDDASDRPQGVVFGRRKGGDKVSLRREEGQRRAKEKRKEI